MQCRDFREIADSYLSDELLIETNHEVISHLEDCAECRREMSARREARGSLRAAFGNAPERQIRAEFGEQLKLQLKASALNSRRASLAAPRGWWSSGKPRRTLWLALAASLIVVAGFGLFMFRQKLVGRHSGPDQVAGSHPESNRSPQSNPRQAVAVAKMELAKSAVGDHRDCAIQFRLAQRPIDLEEAGQKYDAAYTNLQKAVTSKSEGVLAQAEFVEAHSCVFEGRRFAHLVLRYHGRIVSLLVTDLNGSDEGKANSSRPLSGAQPHAIACSQLEGYQVSCFETARHAVFVVSDLSAGENLAVAEGLAPAVIAHLARTEIAI